MSAQTQSTAPDGPASSRLVDRARFRVSRWRSEPNPLWIRELRQSARLTRTPVILVVLVVLMTMLITSIGGLMAAEASPATTGVVIFQVFFSLAYFVVTVLGPAVAANSIASEREGRTWEAVILTGLSPATIARGKLLAGFTSIGMYIVMLAPVGALPFLFGGVTAIEVVVAFAGLFLVALFGVAFGLAVSSRMASVRSAIVVTLLLAFPMSTTAFLTFGVGLSFRAHQLWAAVPEGPPVWLPTAYARAPFGADYVVFLVLMPLLAVIVPAWFLYEVTIANLTGPGDDRASGLKRWFTFAAPALTVAAAVPIAVAPSGASRAGAAVAGIVCLFLFLVFSAFLFVGDVLGPSRRVKARWDRAGAGSVVRFFGPGIVRSSVLLLAGGALALGGLMAAGALGSALAPVGPGTNATGVLLFGAYGLGFFVFVVGLAAWLRSRTAVPLAARLLMLAVLFGVAVAPWVVMAIGGIVSDRWDSAMVAIAAPSPFFAFALIDAPGKHAVTVNAGIAAAIGWGALGAVLMGAASRTCAGIVRRHEAALAEGDRRLAAEDEAAHAAVALPEPKPEPEPRPGAPGA